MDKKLLDITPRTLVGDMLNTFPFLEDVLIDISPTFKKLKNPVLRRTVAKVATLKQAAAIGGLPVGDLINRLRKAAGLDEVSFEDTNPENSERPEWISEDKIKFTYDASIDLENGIHPAGKVTKEIHQLKQDELYQLITPFTPAPLIGIIREKGFEVYSEKRSEMVFHTYIKAKSE